MGKTFMKLPGPALLKGLEGESAPKPPVTPAMSVVGEETPEQLIRKQRRKSGFESAMNPTALGSKMQTGLKTSLG